MTEQPECDFCGDPIEGEPVKIGTNVYCSQACAFEAGRSTDCGGRIDTAMQRDIDQTNNR